jgi:hypothetical protein
VVSYLGPSGPAVAVSLASPRGGEPATELTSSRSYTTNGDATSRLPSTYRVAADIEDRWTTIGRVTADEWS